MWEARPSRLKSNIAYQLESNSYHFMPCRAETGWAWWLLCHPSPRVNTATHQLLVEGSRVGKRREPQIRVAELMSQVAWCPRTVRRKIPQSKKGHPPATKSTIPRII